MCGMPPQPLQFVIFWNWNTKEGPTAFPLWVISFALMRSGLQLPLQLGVQSDEAAWSAHRVDFVVAAHFRGDLQ
jgi:hypothetical protein